MIHYKNRKNYAKSSLSNILFTLNEDIIGDSNENKDRKERENYQ